MRETSDVLLQLLLFVVAFCSLFFEAREKAGGVGTVRTRKSCFCLCARYIRHHVSVWPSLPVSIFPHFCSPLKLLSVVRFYRFSILQIPFYLCLHRFLLSIAFLFYWTINCIATNGSDLIVLALTAKV
jgi:hypothetical protein